MSPKLTIAYESADASPAPAANPGDRIDAMFEAAEERHRAARRVVSMLLRALVYLGALLTTAVLLFLVGFLPPELNPLARRTSRPACSSGSTTPRTSRSCRRW